VRSTCTNIHTYKHPHIQVTYVNIQAYVHAHTHTYMTYMLTQTPIHAY